MNQLQALWDKMAQNQIINPKTLPVQNQEKKEEKTKKKCGRKPKANSQINCNERSEQEINQNIRYSYDNSTFFCKQCGDQSSDFNWFAKHVGEHRTEQLGIGEYPLKILKMEDGLALNPWAGKDVSAFLKYCCPECEFNNNDLQLFSEHAFENHTNAASLFSDQGNSQELRLTRIKVEEFEDSNDFKWQISNHANDQNKDSDQGNLLIDIDNKTIRR